ncbi:MAG: anion permease [Desulfovibrio sp.]|jgi:di/tricarboxylate transporter|nr:anion permease [Desulfovibrio sp.]
MTSANASARFPTKFPPWAGWGIVASLSLLAAWLLDDPADDRIALFWFGTVITVLLFTLNMLPCFAVSVIVLMYFIAVGVTRPELALSGWTSPVPWLSLCGMLMGALIERSRLAARTALFFISGIGASAPRLYLAFLLSGYLLSAVIPDMITVVIVFMTTACGMCSALALSPDSRAAAAVIMAAFFGATISSASYLPNSTGIIALLALDDMDIAFTWTGFFLENLPYQLLHALVAFFILHAFGGAELAAHITRFQRQADDTLRALGRVSAEEKKILLLAVLALLAFATESLHGVPGYFAFCGVVMLGYTPVFGLLKDDDLKRVNFPILFFISTCVAIADVADDLGIPARLVSLLTPHLGDSDSLIGAALLSYFTGVLSCIAFTPVTAAATLSRPLAETALALGLEVKPVLYSFLYGLDQFFLPYAMAPALIMFSTGFIRVEYLMLVMSLRIVPAALALAATAALYWPVLWP